MQLYQYSDLSGQFSLSIAMACPCLVLYLMKAWSFY